MIGLNPSLFIALFEINRLKLVIFIDIKLNFYNAL